MEKKILFLDTETTWFLQNSYLDAEGKLHYSGNPAYIVQLSLITDLFNPDTLEIKEQNEENIFYDCVWDMPVEAEKVHHHSKESLKGKPVLHEAKECLDHILKVFEWADLIVWHNLQYDFWMIQNAFKMAGREEDIIPHRKKSYCTLEVWKKFPFQKLNGEVNNPSFPKSPKLVELYKFFHDGKEFDNAHDASADTKATRDCFYQIYKRLKRK